MKPFMLLILFFAGSAFARENVRITMECTPIISTLPPGSSIVHEVIGTPILFSYAGLSGDLQTVQAHDDFFYYFISIDSYEPFEREQVFNLAIQTAHLQYEDVILAESKVVIGPNRPDASVRILVPRDPAKMINGNYVHGVELYCRLK